MMILSRGNSVSATFRSTSEDPSISGEGSVIVCRADSTESLGEIHLAQGSSVHWYLVRGMEAVLTGYARKTNYALHSKLEEAYRNGLELYETSKRTNICAGLVYYAPDRTNLAQLAVTIGASHSTFDKLESVLMDALRKGDIEIEFEFNVLLSDHPNRRCASPEEVTQGWPMFTRDVEIRFQRGVSKGGNASLS